MAALKEMFKAHSSDKKLKRYVLEVIPNGINYGNSAFGSMEEVKVDGLLCTAKEIHETLLRTENKQEITAKYLQEAKIMSHIRHPNIVQFMGLCLLAYRKLPLVVTERLEGNLHDFLETVPHIPLVMKRSFLEDVSRGLLYLHNHDPQIIHRDLTAKNVLLTSSLVGKITDLGNLRIANLQPDRLAQTLSRNPGTQVYMPPEVLNAASQYGPSLDIFSFGHLGLFVGLQVFPIDIEPMYSAPNESGVRKSHTEIDRRAVYIEQLERMLPDGERHPLVQLLKKCLQNNPSQRPTTEELITSLEEMKADIEGPYGDFVKADAVRQVVTMRALRKRETKNETELEQTKKQLQQKSDKLNSIQQNLQKVHADLEDRETQLRAKEEEMKRRDAEISRLMGELKKCQAQLLRHQAGGSSVEEQNSQWSKGKEIKQTPLEELKTPLKFKWREGGYVPKAVGGPLQVVEVDGKFYIGGGGGIDTAKVMVYSRQPGTSTWTLLPSYESWRFGMSAVNNKLVLVGGENTSSHKVTNVLGVWDEQSKTWTHPFPVMPTARVSPSVIGYLEWLIVAGGSGENGSRCRNVEILDTVSGQWYEVSPLPNPCGEMSSVVNRNMWYLLGGFAAIATPNKRVFSVCLDELVSQVVARSAGTTSPSTSSPWQILPETPLERSTALVLDGALLALGGGVDSSAIHLYKPSSKEWIEAGELPDQRREFVCFVLPNGEIFAAAGELVRRDGTTTSFRFTDTLYFASIDMD